MAVKSRKCKLCKEKGRSTELVVLPETLRNGAQVPVCPICDYADNGKDKTTVSDIEEKG
jgi:hypothetical protein